MSNAAEKTHWCRRKDIFRPLFVCLKCKFFPCCDLTGEQLQTLHDYPYSKEEHSLREAKTKMYIIQRTTGGLEVADAGFDPRTSGLDGLEKVYVVSKVLVKQTKLVAMTANEREQVKKLKAKAK